MSSIIQPSKDIVLPKLKLPNGKSFELGPNAQRFDLFTKKWLRHVAGPQELIGTPIVLEPYWLQIATDILDTLDDEGNRQYREAFIEIARKNFKSGFSSCMAAYFLVEESRYAAGGQVLAAATAKDQARIVFRASKLFLERSALAKHLRFYKDSIYNPETDTSYAVISSDSNVNYGLDPIFVSFDEVHVHTNDGLYETLRTASIARPEPLMLEITTAGHDQDSLAYDLYTAAKAFEKMPLAKRKKQRFYGKVYEADPKRADDPRAYKAANPASWITAQRLAEEYKGALDNNKLGAFKRQHGNIWTAAVESFLADGVWESLKGVVEINEGDDVLDAVDLGLSRDSTGLITACLKEDGKIHLKARSWAIHKDPKKPAPKAHEVLPAEHHKVPMAEIEEALFEDDERYRLLEATLDPSRMERSTQIIEEHGIQVVEFWQTDGRMVPATECLIEAIHEGRIVHDGDPILASHMAAAVARMTSRGPRLDKKPAKNLMDLAVCVAMAVYRLTLLGETGPSAYFDDGSDDLADDDWDD